MPFKDPEAKRAYQRAWLAANRAAWLSDKSCVRCGSTAALQIDHIDPKQKISHKVWSWSEKRRLKELRKCQVLCEEHHKEKTAASYPPVPHGTHTRYTKYRCRCVACTEAHRLTNARYR